MLVLLLVGASVCGGFSYDKEEYYGSTFTMLLDLNTHSIEFNAKRDSDVTILWNRDNATASSDSRRKVQGLNYVIRDLTQRDSGLYTVRDKDQKVQFTKTLKVKENKRLYKLKPGEKFSFTFVLEPNACNIYFFSKSDNKERGPKNEVVRQGRLQESWNRFDCEGFDVLKPCGLTSEGVSISCNGFFEFWDQNDNKAVVLELEIEQIRNHAIYFYIGVGAFIIALSCCCCMRSCCCRKRSSEKDGAVTTAGTAVNFHEYGSERAGPDQDQLSQPSRTLYPNVPSYTQNNPLLQGTAPAENVDAPTVPLCSDNEPRFELKGIPCPLPLSSVSTHCDVYTSDKLNFR
ncbi:uncharacterized protein [Channa argus]|uniref:uncharacterized protein isoform X2 n=1 Tax=Channa argus TaxID=215402 RepID=UPI003522A02B